MAAYLGSVSGLSAELRLDGTVEDLTRAVDRGEPPIVDLQAWREGGEPDGASGWETDWDDGHYAVLVGYDAVDLFFMDPSTGDGYTFVPRAEFTLRWHDELTGSREHIEHPAIFARRSSGQHPAGARPATGRASLME